MPLAGVVEPDAATEIPPHHVAVDDRLLRAAAPFVFLDRPQREGRGDAERAQDPGLGPVAGEQQHRRRIADVEGQ